MDLDHSIDKVIREFQELRDNRSATFKDGAVGRNVFDHIPSIFFSSSSTMDNASVLTEE